MSAVERTASAYVAPTDERYPRVAVILHWLLAALILTLLASGWYMVDIPRNTPERAFFFNLHKSLGVVAGLGIAALIAWRLRDAAPPLPSGMPLWERKAAVLNHGLFYAFMVVVTAAGYLTSSFSRFGPKLFGIPLPGLWEDAALREQLADVHRVTAWVFAALIAIHVGAALKHWLVDRDGVLQRMLLERRRD